uniref:Uncharacterized protein n=1 Tax=Corethron hystrix TaxID=216773 RepID=A0A7S1FRG1_9STRA|mmetsp:Transcript_22026/g.50276  ORF Transcript_22026/g.50276 Transcript_22026/m.50276 type:complete len:103 (+) Transcript_22026:517-825(+)
MEKCLGAVFMPCGLGRFIGDDTHGYGRGYPPRSSEVGLRSLRTALILENHIVLMMDPGYIKKAFEDPTLTRHLLRDRVLGMIRFGRVRPEDVIAVTKDMLEN